MIFIPQMAQHQIGDRIELRDKRHTGIIRELYAIRKCVFVKDFYEIYKNAYSLPADLKERSPFEGASKGLRSQEQEQEHEQEQEQEHEHEHEQETAERKFDLFWSAFPSGRKEGKGAARKAWKVACKKADHELIVAAAKEYASSHVGQGQFVKGPTSWLEQECWSDDRRAWQRDEKTKGQTKTVDDMVEESRLKRESMEKKNDVA